MGAVYASNLARQSKAGTLLNTYTTAKSVINPDDLIDLPRSFWKIQRGLKVTVKGALSNIVAAPGTIQFLLKLGTTASPVTVYDSGTIQLNATAHVTLPFWLELTLRADKDNSGNGTTTKVFGHGKVGGIMFTKTAGQVDSLQGDQVIAVPQTAPVLGAGFDNTIVNTLDFWAGFSISNAGNGIRIDDYIVTDEGIALSAAA